MTTTITHPAAPGFTAAFITSDDGPFTYQRYTADVNPAVLFNGQDNTTAGYPVDVTALDAQLAADGYLRVGPWNWTDDIWGCAVREITIPVDTEILYGENCTLTVIEAIQVIAAGSSPLTVTRVGDEGKPVPGLSAGLRPVNKLFSHGARVHVGGTEQTRSPAGARIWIACCALAADIAEAANLITVAER